MFPPLIFIMSPYNTLFIFFFFNDTATTEIYTLSLHDALPIYRSSQERLPHADRRRQAGRYLRGGIDRLAVDDQRSEEHTSELQSLTNLVCRLLLEKKKKLALSQYNPDPPFETTKTTLFTLG